MKIYVAAAVVAIITLTVPAFAQTNVFVEDFTTKTYCDTLQTTAWWNATAGQLELYPFEPSIVGTYDTPDNAQIVRVAGDYAFVADYSTGLLIIDISDPTAPTLAGSYDTPGNAKDVFISGNHAFVADDTYGLQVIDISDPATPTLAGSYNTPGNAWGVYVEGDYAFVGDYSFGLQVIDISDPTAPVLAGSYNTSGNAMGVGVDGDYAYVADYTAGLKVIDISDPTTPTLAGSYATPGYARRVYVSCDRVYVADSGSGLQIIDISDPTTPTLAGSYDTPGSGSNVCVSGNQALMADGVSGLQIIDVTDPASPALTETVNTPGVALGVCAAGEHAFVSDGASGLQVVRASVQFGPVQVAYETIYTSRSYDLHLSGHYVVVGGHNYLPIFDISDPFDPTLVGAPYSYYGSRSVCLSGDLLAYESNYEFVLLDVTNPASSVPLDTCALGQPAWDMSIVGDYVYLAADFAGLLVVDIADPNTASVVGSYDTDGRAFGVCVAGNHAYVADSGPGLLAIDITDPAAPALTGSFDTNVSAVDVYVDGDHAFVADLTGGLVIVDVSDPAAPSLLGYYHTPDWAQSVWVSGDFAFIADDDSGLVVIDVSDVTTPTLVGYYDTPGTAEAVVVSGNYAWLADGMERLRGFQVFQADVIKDDNTGQSLAVDASVDSIFGFRLTSTQTDSVEWELSADGGANWQSLQPDDSWNVATNPGIDLLWRSTLLTNTSGVYPSVSQLEIGWILEAPAIDAVADIPGDQGGWVRLRFTRSGRDISTEYSRPIEDYGVWRLVEDAGLAAAVGKLSPIPIKTGVPVIELGDKKFIVSAPGCAAAGTFPPGTWEWVATIPAVQQDTYIAAVPTVIDSSASGPNDNTFVLTAHTTTPSIWYVSAPDSGHSVDNIPPSVPEGFAVAYNTGSGNHLTWDLCPDDDFQYFRVYRSTDPGFVPSPATLLHSTTSTEWYDPEYDGWNVYYKITALDDADNESGYTGAGTTTAVVEEVMPSTTALYQNVPNPFNPVTTITFDIPARTGASLVIYSVTGSVVRTLVDREMAPGAKRVTWDGKDASGAAVASGVYFYRLKTTGFDETKKMILLR